jgi:hypothetical protein
MRPSHFATHDVRRLDYRQRVAAGLEDAPGLAAKAVVQPNLRYGFPTGRRDV